MVTLPNPPADPPITIEMAEIELFSKTFPKLKESIDKAAMSGIPKHALIKRVGAKTRAKGMNVNTSLVANLTLVYIEALYRKPE